MAIFWSGDRGILRASDRSSGVAPNAGPVKPITTRRRVLMSTRGLAAFSTPPQHVAPPALALWSAFCL